MRTKVVFSLIAAVLISSLGWGQGTVSIRVPNDGNFVAFSSKGSPKAVPINPTKIERGGGVVTLLPGDDRVYVWDLNSGNLAWRLVLTGKDFVPELKDYKEIGQVRVRVEASGKPVSAATIEFSDGKKSRTELIAPTSEGVVSFFAVNPGKATVKVLTKGKDKPHEITQVFELSLARPETEPVLTISVPGDVETVGAASSSTGEATKDGEKSGPKLTPEQAAEAEKKSLEPSPLNRILSVVVGLAVAAAVVWFVLQYVKRNPTGVAATLEQLGAQIPKAGDADAVAAPINLDPPKPVPAPKIVLDPNQADPVASTPFVAAPVSSTDQITLAGPSTGLGTPSLVTETGVALPLTEGETLVGRDAGLGLSLTGESTVSRRHAKLDRAGNEVTVTDLGSSNGTYVNGAKVDGTVAVRPGDTVQFGAARFRYEV